MTEVVLVTLAFLILFVGLLWWACEGRIKSEAETEMPEVHDTHGAAI